jgi:hypothetical protein
MSNQGAAAQVCPVHQGRDDRKSGQLADANIRPQPTVWNWKCTLPPATLILPHDCRVGPRLMRRSQD